MKDKDKREYVFKKNPIIAFDFLKAKNISNKVLKRVLAKKNLNIQANFNVNALANKLHPYSQNVKLKQIIAHADKYKSFIFEGDKHQLAVFRPGQYISLSANINGVNISRPYSIVSSPSEAKNKNIYQITLKEVENGFFSKFLFNNTKINDKFSISGPDGQLYYDPIRDYKNLVLIAGDIGITPFISFLRNSIDKNNDLKLTIFYSCKFKKDLIFFDEINKLKAKNSNIDVKYFLTRETNSDPNLFINRRIEKSDLIPYVKESTFFICGSTTFGKGMINILEELKVAKKSIRYETNEAIVLAKEVDYKNINKKSEYKIIVNTYDSKYTIKANANDSILTSIKKAKIASQSRCLNGKCSLCRIKLISGEVYVVKKLDNRRMADIENNIFHSCVTYPISDLEIILY